MRACPTRPFRNVTSENGGMTSIIRHPAAVALLILLGALLVVGAIFVPWTAQPPSRAAQLDAVANLPSGVVDKGKELAGVLRPSSYLSIVIGLVVAAVLGFTPLGSRIVGAVGRLVGGHWLAEAVLGGLVIVLIAQVVTLPISVWRHSVLVRYGISTQSWGPWAWDLAKSYAVTIVVAAVGLAAFYALAHYVPRWWWAWAAAAAGCLVVLMSAVYPVIVEPIFNQFHPMKNEQLSTELKDMARKDNVPVKEVLVSDASRRTTSANAYVSGLGPTRRIVVYDNLLQYPDSQVASVVAHELGHAKRGDVWIGTGLGALGVAAAVCAIPLLGRWQGLLHRAGVDEITAPRGIALLLAVVALVSIVVTPLQNAVSRKIEMRADSHALELTGDPDTFVEMQTSLARTNISDVDPPGFVHWFFGSHPTTAQRIAMAKSYGE